MLVREKTYEEIVLANPGRKLELHNGVVREKPAMTIAHNMVQIRLVRQLVPQLDFDRYDLRVDNSRVYRPDSTYFIPDLFIVDRSGNRPIGETPPGLEIVDEPCLLVAEIWSQSTGDYDVSAKLPEYRRRGDLDIWQLHPYDCTLSAWRRNADGTYSPSTYRGGKIELVAIPGIIVDLEELFV